jgi:quinol monooxygenase YgiN
MVTFFVHHRVKDYTAWKPYYDQNAAMRNATGCKSDRVYRAVADPNDIVIVFQWDKAENARKFSESPDLKAIMEKAGVIGMPEMQVISELERVAK